MMRDLDASSPVVWPPWCYSVDIKRDVDLFGSSKSRRSAATTAAAAIGMQIEHHPVNNNTSSANNNKVADVKTERLSPVAASGGGGGGGGGGGDSASSRSGTPSSSYPGTPPGMASAASDRVASPAPNPLNRNCSDLIRSLAAKYQNANPSEYAMPSRNGLNMSGVLAVANKDGPGPGHGDGLLGPGFPFVAPIIPGTSVPMFPPMMDMSSTQALLSMVRSSQFDAFMSKTATKRPCSASSSSSSNMHLQHAAPSSEQNPLDLSSSSTPCKKPRKGHAAAPVGHWESAAAAAAAAGTFAETFLNIPAAFSLALQKSREKATAAVGGNGRRLGSLSPAAKAKPCQATAPNRALPCVSSCGGAGGVQSPPVDNNKQTGGCPNGPDKSAVAAWTVDDVCDFVGTIDLCAEYSQCFREQSIDGTALPLLSEDHLTGTMNMKLGPALKFRAVLARKLGNCALCMHCAHCHGAQSHGGGGRHSPSSPPAGSSSVQS